MIDVVGFERDRAQPVVALAATRAPTVVSVGVEPPPDVAAPPPPPVPVEVNVQLPVYVESDAAGLATEKSQRIAGDNRLQAEIDALGGATQSTISQLQQNQLNSDAETQAQIQSINNGLNDEIAAREQAILLEQQARTNLSTSVTQSLAQASADIAAAHAAADQAAQDAANALTTAQAEIAQSSADAAAALATAKTDLQSAINATAGDLQTAIDAVQASSDGVLAQLNTETTARQNADAAEVTARQTAIAGVQSDIGTVAAALTTESQTRATNDTAETTARQAAIATVQGNVDTVSAGLANEITARANADTAETNARQTQVSQVQNNVDTVAAGLLSESSTRASADAAETSARQSDVSSLQGQINTTTAAITAEANTRATNDTAETNARTAAVSSLQGQINSTNAALTTESSTRATNDAAETSARQAAISSVQNDVAAANAAITAEANTRASADSAETSARQVQISQVSSAGGALTDPLFSRSTLNSVGLPWGWGDWSWGTTISSIVAGKIGPNALKITNDAAHGVDQGIYIGPGVAWNGPDMRTNRYFVLEVDVEYVSGDLTGAGVLFYAYDGTGGLNDGVTDRVAFSTAIPSPQAGRIYAIRKFIDGYGGRVPSTPSAVNSILHLFGAWGGFSAVAATKTFIVHRINPRPATQSEIETGTAGGAIAAAITNEANTRATNDAAETSQRQAAVSSLQAGLDSANAAIVAEQNTRATNDTAETNARQAAISSVQSDIAAANAAITNEANTRAANDATETSARQSQVSDLQGQINSATAAITNEANTRATNDAAETNARTSAVSSLSAKGSPKRLWSQSTAPTYADIFPPGVQACPVGNLDGNPFQTGAINTWTNTARVVDTGIDAGSYTLEGGHTVYAFLSGAWAAQGAFECFDLANFGGNYGITPGVNYEWSVYTGAHRCRVYLYMFWIDANGLGISINDSLGDPANINDWELPGGTILSGYKRLSMHAVAPAGAVRCQVGIRADNQGVDNKAGQGLPYIFATRPQWARVATGAPQPIDWQPFDAPVWINTGDANRRLRWSGILGATWLEESDTRIAANAAAITSEASTRASADAAETSQRQAAISAVQTDIASNLAAINSEASTRATNDAAETSARQSAVSGLQNSINSINAAITSEQNTRATNDLAETTARQQQVSQLTSPGGALVDPLFARNAIANNVIPWGWGDWAYGASLCSIVAGRISDKALLMTDPGAADTGIVIGEGDPTTWSGASHRTSRYFVVEIDFEWLSGDPKGAGFLLYGSDSDTGSTTNWAFAGFKELTGPSPTIGKIYSMRKFVDGYAQHVPANPAHVQSIFHLFGGWGTIYYDQQGNTTPVAKSFKIHRANVRAATQPEIDAGTAGGAIGAAITSEANTRASADAAETSARQSDVSNLQNGLNSANALIVAEQNTRASADSAEATARLTLSSSLSAQISPKRTFTTPTQPTFDDMFPANVQACPVGSLKPSDGVNGVAAWSNTARGYDAAALWTDGPWNLTGEASLATHLTGTWANSDTTYEVIDLQNFGQCFNVVAGRRYEWSVYTGAHRCRVYASLTFYDNSWNNLGSVDSTGYGGLYGFGGVNSAEKPGGNSLSDWKRLGMIAQAPAGATRAAFTVRGDNVGFAGQSDPYVIVCRPYFGRARNDQTTLTDWQPFEPALWIKTSEGNKPYLWSGIYGTGFVAADDTRLATNTANISQLFSTTDGLSVRYGIQGTINGATGGFMFSGILKNDGTVAYNLEINSNVTIHGNVVIDGTITNSKVGNINLSAPTFANGSSGTASVTVALRGGVPVVILAKAGSALISQNELLNVTVKQGSTILATETPITAGVYDPNVGSYSNYNVPPAFIMTSFTPPSDGDYTFSVTTSGSTWGLSNYHPPVSIYVDRPYK